MTQRKPIAISRRKLLLAGAAVPLCAILTRPAAAAEFSYKLATGQDPTHPVNVRAKEASDRIKEATSGRLEINVFPANQLGSDTDLLTQVRNGSVEFFNLSSLILATLVPAAGLVNLELVKPLFEFRNFGLQLPHHWSTVSNGAAFGTDYFTRTAVGKSNIFVNAPTETRYFYQDLDASGARLNGVNRYTVTFAKDQTPPVNGFWSLTLYNQHHFFEPNKLKRYSTGTKNKALKANPDGSLAIYVQADPPSEPLRGNWLPAPKGGDFSLYVRSYWPKVEITDGSWTPPAVMRVN
jgi:hypothetical protein